MLTRIQISLPAILWIASSFTAVCSAATGSTCGTPESAVSSTKCHEPRECQSSASIDIGKFSIGFGGSSGAAAESCCRVLEYIPAHNTKGPHPEYALIKTSKEGWTKTGHCMPSAISILGVVSIPSGERYCEYGPPIPTTIDHYEADGYCASGPNS
jgi:hypothetical protein